MIIRKDVSIIGAGVVGTSLGYLLKKNGYKIVSIGSRTLASAEKAREFIGEGRATDDVISAASSSGIVFITTPDDAIEEVCNKIAEKDGFQKGAVVFHVSGALPSTILITARKKGAKIASLHPLQSLASVEEGIKNIPGSYFFMEGDKEALSVAREIVNAFGGKEITLDVKKKVLYHAGAAVASNFLVATIGFAMELFETAGINREDALEAIKPLINGTIKNIYNLGIPKALTGPISRGDKKVVEDHLKAISKNSSEMLRLYSEIGKYTVKLGVEKGTLKEDEAKKILAIFDDYLKGKVPVNENSCY
jgi:predicted short-subunit dehydrogenase-like oxidoreductase (DUF2520 family)